MKPSHLVHAPWMDLFAGFNKPSQYLQICADCVVYDIRENEEKIRIRNPEAEEFLEEIRFKIDNIVVEADVDGLLVDAVPKELTYCRARPRCVGLRLDDANFCAA